MQRYFDQKTLLPFLDTISENVDIISNELDGVLNDPCWQPWPEKLWDESLGHEWKVIPLFAFGRWASLYCEKFPQTKSLLSSIPTLRTALFSRLGPKTILKPHTGWAELANNVLRCHLGIKIPSTGESGLWVDGEKRSTKPGEWLIFDDSLLHSGFNLSNEDRIVIIVDVERPKSVPSGKAVGGYTEEVVNLINETIGF